MATTHDSDEHDPEGTPGALALEPSSTRSVASRAVAATVVLAMALGGLVLATRAGGGREADELLSAAKTAFTTEGSYRFTFRTTEELSAGDKEGAGVDTVTRTLTTGEVAAPNRWRISTDEGAGWTEESIRLDATLYRRNLDEHDAGNDGRWIVADARTLDDLGLDDLVYELQWLDAEDPDTGSDLGDADRAWRAAMRSSARLGIVATGHALDSAADPARLTRLVRDADDAEIVDDGGEGTTLRATVPPPPALAEAITEPLPDAEVEIDLDADDRPLAVRVELAENGAVLRVDLRFSDWGAPVTIEAPDGEAIDHTPSIDEEGLRAADAALLLAPAHVPDGLVLRSAMITPGADGCSIATLEYWPVTEQDLSQAELDESLSEGPYLWLNTHLRRCEDILGVGIDKEFDQRLGGHPARSDWGWEVNVGPAVVSLDTNLDADTLDRVAGSLRTVGADELIDSVETGGG